MARKLKILVVDDQKVIGDLFEFTLGYSGHSITFVDNADAAFKILKEKSFDFAFLDIVMPGLDGVATIKRMKELKPSLPIVMMSGYSVEDKKKEAKEVGAVGCLRKPFEMEDVEGIIKDVLKEEI